MDVDLQALRHRAAHDLHLLPLGGGEPRWGNYTGTKALMLAVLEDGLASYLGPAGHRRNEAEAWVMAAPGRSPFSFTVICETLGLEPNAVRLAPDYPQAAMAQVQLGSEYDIWNTRFYPAHKGHIIGAFFQADYALGSEHLLDVLHTWQHQAGWWGPWLVVAGALCLIFRASWRDRRTWLYAGLGLWAFSMMVWLAPFFGMVRDADIWWVPHLTLAFLSGLILSNSVAARVDPVAQAVE